MLNRAKYFYFFFFPENLHPQPPFFTDILSIFARKCFNHHSKCYNNITPHQPQIHNQLKLNHIFLTIHLILPEMFQKDTKCLQNVTPLNLLTYYKSTFYPQKTPCNILETFFPFCSKLSFLGK